jgi:hypothetical protein
LLLLKKQMVCSDKEIVLLINIHCLQNYSKKRDRLALLL